MTIHQLRSAFLSKKLSPLNVWEYFSKRIISLNELNCLITVTNDLSHSLAMASAARYAENRSLGLFDGVPFVVKDNFCVEGVRTTCASKMLDNFTAPYTATVVQRLIDAGGVLLGKTNLDEFAMGCGTVDGRHGPVRNPWSPPSSEKWHIAGGSSGGSAAAVAAGLAVAAVGSDTGGSTRNPAAYCGVVGLKPTYGRVSRHGLIPLVNSLDVPGLHTKTVNDCAAMLEIIQGFDPRDSTTLSGITESFVKDMGKPINAPPKLRVGIPKEYHAPGLHLEVAQTWDMVAGWLSDAGCSVERISLPHTQYSIKCYSVLCCVDVASNMARYDGVEYGHRAVATSEESFLDTEHLYAASRREGFNEVVRSRILAGNYFLLRENLDRYLHQAQRIWRLVHADFLNAFATVDVLLTPVTLTDAPRFDEFSREDNRTRVSRDDVCTQPVNLAGVPALSLPIRLSNKNLPLALQLVGPHNSEATLFSLARWIEARAEFPELTPLHPFQLQSTESS